MYVIFICFKKSNLCKMFRNEGIPFGFFIIRDTMHGFYQPSKFENTNVSCRMQAKFHLKSKMFDLTLLFGMVLASVFL